MRAIAAGTIAAAALLGLAGAAQAKEPSVDIKDAVARVTVVPSDRADVEVVIKNANPKLPLKVTRRGDRIVVDGDLRWNKIRNCRGSFERAEVEVRDVGKVTWADMPEVIIYTPRNVDIGAGGAVWGYIGRAESVDLAAAGCGDWQVGNVTGKLDISQAGSGDVYAGSAGMVDISVAGSGDTRIKAIAGGADISIAGSGDVELASISGPMDVSIAGSGDVRVLAGSTPSLDVSIAGSGNIRFAGEAGNVDATIMGSGDIQVFKVSGTVDKTVMGSGSVTVGPFEARRN